MAKSSNQKLKILYIMQMLLEETDEEHGISVKEIIEKLAIHDISAERKSIYNDIDTLIEFGMDIITIKSKEARYFVGSREFELAELKLLVDAVQCSKFITEKKSYELIRKLERLTSKNEAALLHRDVHVIDRVKRTNENIYYNVDRLHNAIANNRKIAFRYFEYDVNLKKVFRKDGAKYIENPYGLSWSDDNYYMIAFSDKYEDYTHYRVDRMTDIEVIDESRKSLPIGERFNVADYCKKMFNMFGGEDIRVHIKFQNDLINPIIDRFGKKIIVTPVDCDWSETMVNATKSSTFYGWLAQFGDRLEVVGPEDVRSGFVQHMKEILINY